MKKVSVYAVLLSLGMMVIGCAPPKPVDKPKTDAPPAEAPKDMSATGEKLPVDGDKPATDGDKPAEPAAPPAEPGK